MNVLTRDEVVTMVRDLYEYRQTEVSESDFATKYSYGYLCSKDSVYDLLTLFTTDRPSNYLFTSFEEIADDLIETLDDEVTEDKVKEYLSMYISAFDDIMSRSNSPIVG
jgi:hypothetical protein